MADTRLRGNVSEKSIDSHGKDALEKIFKSREILLDQQVISQLKKTLSDSKLVDVVFDFYKKRLEQIKEKSNKFKQALLRKYSLRGLSTRELIEKAKKYTKKYDLTEGEFQMFVNLLLNEPTQQYQSMFNIPSTPMSRTLGYSADAVMGDKLVIGENDFPHFKTIMDLEKTTKQLHNQLVLQTLTYSDCGPDALNGKFNKSRDNPFKYVHPIIAAMFLPKVPYLDEHMLLASIPNIIKCKNEGKPIITINEYELYWDMITDPNQSVCVTDNSKTMEDLKNRSVLQTKLWESVMNLRMGKYYADDMSGFLSAIETCQNSIFDAPDLVYTHDEGTVLRRILNAFSLRPTVVSISSISGLPMAVSTLSLSPAQFSQVTTVPMINLRLPRTIGSSQVSLATVSLTDSLSQSQWFIEGKTLVPKAQTIVHSRDVLFFYVDRRFKSYNYASYNKPYVFTGLPPTMSGLDSINETRVQFSQSVRVGEQDFDLRSVVFAEVTNLGKNGGKLITGCTAGVVMYPDPAKGISTEEYVLYDPKSSGSLKMGADRTPYQTEPMSAIRKLGMGASDDSAFYPMAEKQGTVFMYVKRH